MVQGLSALTNAIWAVSCVNKSPPENLAHYPKFFEDILKNVIISCVSENFSSLWSHIYKSSDSQENFVFSPQKDLLKLEMLITRLSSAYQAYQYNNFLFFDNIFKVKKPRTDNVRKQIKKLQ